MTPVTAYIGGWLLGLVTGYVVAKLIEVLKKDLEMRP